MFIQWYEITGTSGGSLWILASNLFLTVFITKSISGKKVNKSFLTLWLIVIFIPSVFSVIRYNTIEQNKKYVTEIVIIQPNIDPYTEKFSNTVRKTV